MTWFKKISSFLFLAALIVVVYFYRAEIKQVFNFYQNIIDSSLHPPCSRPVTYRLGNIDSRFNLSKEDLSADLLAAEKIWEEPLQKNLFAAGTPGMVVVNLVYDYRQEAVDLLKKQGLQVESSQSSYEKLKSEYNALETQYQSLMNEYNKQKTQFEKERLQYEQQVNFWNKRGGATEKEYNELEKEKQFLIDYVQRLNSQEDKINSLVREVNALALTLNKMASQLNLQVKKYNSIGQSLGAEFDEGVYRSDASGQSIDVYEFSSREQLIRLLAHELGHALSLEHVEDPLAIMYRLNNSKNDKITAADLAQLNLVCKLR